MATQNDDNPSQRLNDEYHTERLTRAEELLLPGAERGEWPAIQELLEIIADALDDGSPLTPRVAAYLSAGLRTIADGYDHVAAFNIRRRRGEKDIREAREQALHNAYELAYLKWQGNSLEKARQIMNDKTGIPEETLKKQWRRHSQRVKRDIQRQIERFGKPVDPSAVRFSHKKLFY
jgi:hypothetical protein